ncbi:MAG TPA: HAD-IB family hydrolase [Acidimicrobiia bacterium]|nr:HAD-IB family hydrolase [Acidimicrobiia bacterium]
MTGDTAGEDASRVVAAFDFDGTITRRDTLLPFLVYACGRARVAAALATVAPRLTLALAGRGSRDDAKVALLERVVAGRDAAEIAAAGRAFADRLAADTRRFRADVLERVRWHRDAGHEVVLVSASLTTYLDPLAPRLGFDTVLATTLEVASDGRLTGQLVGLNCRGPEKVARLDAWLAGSACTLWAYGDSSGDDEMLARADRPARVGRTARSTRRSTER